MGSRRGGAIAVERSGRRVAVLALHGEHDLATVPDLDQELETLLREEVSIVADLSDTAFMDCATLSVLAGAEERARERGLRFVLVLGTVHAVRRLLEVTGYDRRFRIAESRAEGLAEAARERENE